MTEDARAALGAMCRCADGTRSSIVEVELDEGVLSLVWGNSQRHSPVVSCGWEFFWLECWWEVYWEFWWIRSRHESVGSRAREEGSPTRGETGVVARLSSRVCRLELQGRGWW